MWEWGYLSDSQTSRWMTCQRQGSQCGPKGSVNVHFTKNENISKQTTLILIDLYYFKRKILILSKNFNFVIFYQKACSFCSESAGKFWEVKSNSYELLKVPQESEQCKSASLFTFLKVTYSGYFFRKKYPCNDLNLDIFENC